MSVQSPHIQNGSVVVSDHARLKSTWPAELQRLARKLKFACSKFINYTFQRANSKVLIRLCRCRGWSAPLLFTCSYIRFSRHSPERPLRQSFNYYEINQAGVIIMIALLFFFSKSDSPGHVAQSVTCLATDASQTADPGVASSILARSHTFVEIDCEIICTVILLPSADSFKKCCCQLQVKV